MPLLEKGRLIEVVILRAVEAMVAIGWEDDQQGGLTVRASSHRQNAVRDVSHRLRCAGGTASDRVLRRSDCDLRLMA